jgi:1-acyl-sn-glycerol-3-phosphate acyltransferase
VTAPGTPPGEWTLYTRLVAFLARLLVWALALGRVRVEGGGDLPASGPLIVVANHISNLDPPLVGGWLAPALHRRPRFLAKEPLFKGPLGWFLRSQGVIPVRAGGRDVEAYRAAKAALDAGSVIVIFPEGTRSFDGVLQEPLPGVALLASRTGVPILPAGASNTDQLLGRGRRLPRFGTRVTLRVGRPFTLALDATLGRREALAAANDRIMGEIAALVDARHRGRFG